MNTEALIWKLFECTGDVCYYLLYKGVQESQMFKYDEEGMSL